VNQLGDRVRLFPPTGRLGHLSRVGGRNALFRALLVTGAMALAAGCSSANGPNASPAPNPGVEQQDAWVKCGARAAPPASVTRSPSQLPPIINATSGAVSEAEANQWVAAFIREQAIETWAQTELQDRFLSGGCLGDPAANEMLFAGEIDMVKKARQEQAQLTVQPPSFKTVRLVTVPAAVQNEVLQHGGAKSSYALVVGWQGPAQVGMTYGGGKQEVLAAAQAGQAYYAFYAGTFHSSSLGPLWYQEAVLDCGQSFLHSLCST
jgi:hypothetical protein